MNGQGPALVAFGGGLAIAYATAGVVPIPEAGFVIQSVVLGGALGTLVGLLRERRDPDVDFARDAAVGGFAGLIVGVLVLVVVGVVNGVR